MLRSLLLLVPLAVVTISVVATSVGGAENEELYIWGPDQRGRQAGARLVSATGKLQPGDPVVVEFVLKNTSAEKQTLVIQQYDDTHPTCGENNRIELNILGSSQRRWQHELEPGEILKKRQYRVTFSSEGFPQGEYQVTAGSAFWLTIEPNRGSGVPHGRPIPLTIGDPHATKLNLPQRVDDPRQAIHWGHPVGGLVVGARFVDGKTRWNDGEDVEANLFLHNATDAQIKVEQEIPAVPSYWNLHLEREDDQYVRLDSTWFSGADPMVTRELTINAGQQIQITGVNGMVSTGGNKPIEQIVPGPAIALLKERTEFQHGDPKRLIGGKGKYTFHVAVTMKRADIPDLSMVLTAGGIPFEVNADAE